MAVIQADESGLCGTVNFPIRRTKDPGLGKPKSEAVNRCVVDDDREALVSQIRCKRVSRDRDS